jgi:hypothetical protein
MKHRQFAALGGVVAALAVALAITAPALGAGAPITVRVEGLTRTLLPATASHAESGSVTRAGATPGACPGSNAIGYFDSATHHRWQGSFSSFGIAVTNVLGENHPFTSKFFWGLWVNNRFASLGLCDLKLKPGDALLVAPAPDKGTLFPVVLTAPAAAKVGKPFTVKTSYFKTTKGKAKTLGGVKVTDAKAATGKRGAATVTVTKPGKVTLIATLKGFIRAEATVKVAK